MDLRSITAFEPLPLEVMAIVPLTLDFETVRVGVPVTLQPADVNAERMAETRSAGAYPGYEMETA